MRDASTHTHDGAMYGQSARRGARGTARYGREGYESAETAVATRRTLTASSVAVAAPSEMTRNKCSSRSACSCGEESSRGAGAASVPTRPKHRKRTRSIAKDRWNRLKTNKNKSRPTQLLE